MQITHALGQPVHVGHFALKYFFFLNFKYSMFNATGLSRRKVLMEFRRTRLLFADELVTSATPFTAWQIQVERRRAFWPLCKWKACGVCFYWADNDGPYSCGCQKKCWSYTWPAAIMISISPSDPLPPDAAVTEIRHFLRHFSRVAALFFFFGTRSRSQRVTAECNGIGAEPKRAVTFTTHIHASAVPLLLNSRITRRKKKENRLQKKKKTGPL